MSKTAWNPPEETISASESRRLACKQKEEEVDFWSRNDLVYIGDLSWTQSPAFVGYEYIADVSRRGNTGFQYKYGLLGMANPELVGQTMICDVRDLETDLGGFEMLIGNEWQIGPLKMWLDTLAPDIQAVARSRYQDLVAWVRNQI